MATFDLGRVTPLYKGDYSASASYELNDVVLYNGNLYWHVQVTATVGILPTDTTVWKLAFADEGVRAEIRGYADTAQNSADSANASKLAAAQSASQASASESHAALSAQTAQTAETGATASAQTASTKASEASAFATSAGQSATNAAASATNAASSASAAQGVLESIPEDYSDLSEDVDKLNSSLGNLKEDLSDLESAVFATTHVSGNIIHIADAFGGKLEDFEVTLTDNSVSTVDINLCGKNLYDKNDASMIVKGFIDMSNNWFKYGSDSRAIIFRCNPFTTYTISHNYSGNIAFMRVGTYPSFPNWNVVLNQTTSIANTDTITITTDGSAKYCVVQFSATGFDANIKPTIQVEVGSSKTTFEAYTAQTATITVATQTGWENLELNEGINNIYTWTDCSMSCDYYINKIEQRNLYPSLTDVQKNQIVALANAYLTDTAKFAYNGGAIRDVYSSAETAISSNKFKINCGLFAQLVWMGRSASDFDLSNYSSTITKAFDWGHYFDFPLRKRAFNVLKNSDRDASSFYGFTKPNADNYEDSYSYNSYYGGATWNSAGQYFREYAYAADMAHELYTMGCEIPRSELEVGDLVFYRGADDESMSIGTRLNFRTISHVAVVVDTNYNNSGYMRVIEATFQNSDNQYTIAESSVTLQNDYDALRACFYEERIVMCARHPYAFGKNNAVPNAITNIV